MTFHSFRLSLFAIASAATAVFANPAQAQGQSTQDRPNFLFIITDDMRWDAMSVVQREQGERGRFPWFQTPNLDRLASEGVRFRNAMVATAVCSPSRAEFLTGRYGHYNGVASNQIHFPVENATWASHLQTAGYNTAYVGKWHMGNQNVRPGFDYFASYTGQGKYEDWFFLIDGVKTATKGWIDDVSTDFAIDFMKRDRDEPFALALGYKTPHIPFIPPARANKRYLGEKVGSAPNFHDNAPFLLSPEARHEPATRAEQPLWAIDYFQCISAMDENIGRLLDALDEQGLAENTVVAFTSDNGYYLGEHGLGDYMGDKRSPYEEAMRVPMLVRYPNGNAAGTVSDALTLNIDLAPTLLDMAGVAIPDEIQGQSWAKLLSKPNSKFRKGFFYEYFFETKFSENPTMLAYRTKDAKLIKYPGHDNWTELFDLKNDPYERKNLTSSPEHRSLLKRMEKAYETEKEAVGYHVPDYADPVEPHGTLPTRKKLHYHWLDR